MENTNQTVYIIDLWNPYTSDKVVSTFKINNRWWAIKEVYLNWGEPAIDSIEDDPIKYKIYNTIQEAQEYVKSIKRFEGIK